MQILISLFGFFLFLGFAYLVSNNRKHIKPKLIIWGVVLQFSLAFLAIGIPALNIPGPLAFIFTWANDIVLAIIGFTLSGSNFLFGDLVNVPKSGFIVAFHILPTIIYFSSLMAVLYHLKIMQKVIHGLAFVMQKTMGTSGAESLSMAANIFVGQTEAPLVIKPYLKKMTQSELFTLMTGGMATVAGSVLAAYVGLLSGVIPNIAGHLLTASIMSAPAALVIAKIMFPETKTPETLGQTPKNSNESPYSNVIEAAASGAGDGLKMALNVAAMLIAFIAIIALINAIISFFGDQIGFATWGKELMTSPSATPKLTLELILGWIFAPVAFVMGIPWSEAPLAGSLLGEKVILNEFVAYAHLSQITEQFTERSLIILSYALCGFANFSSIAIQIGGIGQLVPERRSELAQFGIRSVIGGSLAAFMTATIAGMFI
jgi:CNT family concentrative nucleoside transporter